jgi:DNA-binding phage protein
MELMERLQKAIETRGILAKLARSTGLSHVGIRKIALGQTSRPAHETVVRIQAALDQLDNSQQPTEGQPAEADGVSDGDDAVGVRA